jgi:hypothetical protein
VAINWGGLAGKVGDLAIAKLDSEIDREKSEPVRVKDPTPVVTTENTGAPTDPATYQAGTTSEPLKIAGMPWHQALLIGSVGLLALGVTAKVLTR